jgi:vitamin B12 transporter
MDFLNSVPQAPGARSAWVVAVCVGCVAGQAQAADVGQPLEPMVVTATRTLTRLSQVLADVTIITREEVERQGAGDLGQLLSRQPGIEIDRTGGPGSTTGVFIRGGDSRFTAVLIDGVRVDSQSTGGAPWGAIPLSVIDRVEIVRGPLSALYGSDAVSGVVQIFTRKGSGKPVLTLGAGVGSFETTKTQASMVGAEGAVDYAWSLASERSHGFNAVALKDHYAHVADDDGYRSLSGNVRFGWQVNPGHRLEATAVSHRLRSHYDEGVPDVDDVSTSTIQTLGLSWAAKWTEHWRSRIQVAQAKERYAVTPATYDTGTRVRTMSWQNDWQQGPHGVHVTAERREDMMDNVGLYSAYFDGRRAQNGWALGYDWRGDALSVQANVRSDDDTEFGDHQTGSVAGRWQWSPAWQVSASLGSAFRAPTLYQRFSQYGEALLTPEQSLNRELSLRYKAGAVSFSATAFLNKIDDLIAFKLVKYGNVNRVRLQGLSLAGEVPLTAGWRASGSLDLQSARNLVTGEWLIRRAREHLSLQVEGPGMGWDLGAQMSASGSRHDIQFDASYNEHPVKLSPYVVFNVFAQRAITPDLKLLFKLDNVFDRDHETAYGYRFNPRSAFVGLNLTLGR